MMLPLSDSIPTSEDTHNEEKNVLEKPEYNGGKSK